MRSGDKYMCGRFANSQPKLVAEMFPFSKEFYWEPNYNVVPTQEVSVIACTDIEIDILPMRWGYIPWWNKETKPKVTPINARIETVFQSRLFKSSAIDRHCIIPVSGYYEWQTIDKKKQPFYINRTDSPVMALAGIFDKCGDKYSFAILTQEANQHVKHLHHRMPVILSSDLFDKWLDPAVKFDNAEVLIDSNEIPLQFWRVSTNINNPRFNNENCLVNIDDSAR